MRLVCDKPLLFADGRIRHCFQHAAAASADWGYSSCRSADKQHSDQRPTAHSPVCVCRRTQTLRTRKTSCRLTATHNAGRRPQRSQWPSATKGRCAVGERHTGNVTRGNKMADWTVPIKRRWQCRQFSFTAQLHYVCVERKCGQLKQVAWKSAGESEIQHILEPSRKVSCGGNWQQQWTSTLTGCSYMFRIVAGGQDCQRGGLDHKQICKSSTACCEQHKDNGSWQTELVHLVPI